MLSLKSALPTTTTMCRNKKLSLSNNNNNNNNNNIDTDTDDVNSPSGEMSKSMPVKLVKLKTKSQNQIFIESISIEDFAHLLKTDITSEYPGELLVIDLRKRTQYNKGHITGSVLAPCSLKVPIRSCLQIMSDSLSERQRVYSQEVVVYMSAHFDIKLAEKVSEVVRFIEKMNKKVRFLEGGYEAFNLLHYHLCDECQPELVNSLSDSVHTPINGDMSQIFPFLFLGNEYDASDDNLLTIKSIDHILNATSELPFHPLCSEKFNCSRIPIDDSPNQNIQKYFKRVFDLIENVRSSESRLLVHCQAGVSRSAALLTGYIMAHSSLGLQSAFQFLTKQRPCVSPNFGFLGQLYQLESDLKSGYFPRSQILHDCGYLPRS